MHKMVEVEAMVGRPPLHDAGAGAEDDNVGDDEQLEAEPDADEEAARLKARLPPRTVPASTVSAMSQHALVGSVLLLASLPTRLGRLLLNHITTRPTPQAELAEIAESVFTLTSAAEAAAAAAGGPASLDSWVQRRRNSPPSGGGSGPASGPFPPEWDVPDDGATAEQWEGGFDGGGDAGYGGDAEAADAYVEGQCAKWDVDASGETVCVAETPQQAAALAALQAKQARSRAEPLTMTPWPARMAAVMGGRETCLTVNVKRTRLCFQPRAPSFLRFDRGRKGLCMRNVARWRS